jgi:hypothetical protein
MKMLSYASIHLVVLKELRLFQVVLMKLSESGNLKRRSNSFKCSKYLIQVKKKCRFSKTYSHKLERKNK